MSAEFQLHFTEVVTAEGLVMPYNALQGLVVLCKAFSVLVKIVNVCFS